MQQSRSSPVLFTLLLLAGSLFLYACSEDLSSSAEGDFELEGAYNMEAFDFPERPDLGPGESNWAASASKAAASLATTDLNTLTPTGLANALVAGPGVVVSNATFTGVNIAGGTFTGGTGILDPTGFAAGVILSSGNIAAVPGPNTSDNTTTNNGEPGDPDLDGLIPGYATRDCAALEFDFECSGGELGGELQFNYVFTSEEYNEYVNSPFNDVFGFFLNGTNIAVVPSTTTPVSINNVNCNNPYNPPTGSYCSLFRNNDLSDGGGAIDSEMDGLIVTLPAIGTLLPGVNHIKLALADAGDFVLDSNVFIEGGSFTCAITVAIDVKPGSFPNSINTNSRGVAPVAILGSETFDVTTVDVTTLQFGPAGATPAHDLTDPVTYAEHLQDVNGDGFTDLVSHYRQKETGLVFGDTAACIIGGTTGGVNIEGCDSVNIVQ